jgi:hypothetical protein
MENTNTHTPQICSFEIDAQLKSRFFEPDREVLQDDDINVEITDISKGYTAEYYLNKTNSTLETTTHVTLNEDNALSEFIARPVHEGVRIRIM